MQEEQGGERQCTGLVSVPCGAALPDFEVQAVDMWENPTVPCAEMPYALTIESAALKPQCASFDFAPCAAVQGRRLEG